MARRRKLPKFLTARQYAAHLGRSRNWVLGMLQEERIPDAQLTPLGWIIPEDAQLIVRNANIQLPPEFVMEVRPRPMPEYKERRKIQDPGNVSVEVPGYVRATEGMSRREVYNKTHVHTSTQKRLIDGKPVRPAVVRRLSKGLDVPVEILLRRS